MKKVASLFLALALCMGLAVPALALNMTTEEGLAPLSLAIADQYGSLDMRQPVLCDDVLAQTCGYNDLFSMDDLDGYYPVAPDCRITVANLGGSQDCHIRVRLCEHNEMTRAEFIAAQGLSPSDPDEYPDYYFEDYPDYDYVCEWLPEDSSTVYVTEQEGAYLFTNGSWRSYYEGFEGIKRIQEGDSYSFTLPNAEEGKLYKLQVEVCYPDDDFPSDYDCYYYYRYIYLKVDSAAASELAGRFSDVPNSAYYADAVEWAVDKGITAGTSATTFGPEVTCTTAQIITFIWRAKGSPEPVVSNPFTDIAPSDYYYTAAVWASENHLISGNEFNGNTPCTRGETMRYLWTLEGMPDAGNSPFADAGEYSEAVAWAVQQGITSGTSATTFSPNATCTRAQIMTFLYRDMA